MAGTWTATFMQPSTAAPGKFLQRTTSSRATTQTPTSSGPLASNTSATAPASTTTMSNSNQPGSNSREDAQAKSNSIWAGLKDKYANQCNNQGPDLTNNSAQQQQNQSQPSGGLFGSTQPNQQQQSGGLFGNSTQQSQPQATSGLFGTANTQNQNTGTGGLFGGNNNLQSNNTQSTGGLFGGGNTQQNNSGGGLFGSTNNANSQQNATGMFGRPNTEPPKNPQPISSNSAFQGHGGLSGTRVPNNAQNLFGQPVDPPASVFGLGASRAVPSMLGATQHAQMNNSAPFGRLSMGQSNAGPTNTVGAAKVDLESLRPTTRFDDCIDQVKFELEQIDKMIQEQENYAKQIEAFLPRHEEDIKSVGPDIDFIKNKVEDAEQALVQDAIGVDAQRQNAAKDSKDLERCQRILTNLHLPQMYQYTGLGGLGGMYGSQQRPQQAPSSSDPDDIHQYDTDLIGNYFVPMADHLQQKMNAYADNLSEIESHMRVIESSAIMQAQQLAQRKAGVSDGAGQASTEDTVRELADTLRGFEQSIFGVAGVVGECREGINELMLGRLGASLGARS